jgi:GNAT superfamily N-acetyltransferase
VEIASLGYRTDLMIRRLSGSEISDRGSHLVIRTPANPYFWWGNFLLIREKIRAGEWAGWVAEFGREFPDAAHVALGRDSSDGVAEDPDGLAGLGLDLTVDTVMTATALEEPASWPDAEIRPLQSDRDWRQLADLRLSLPEAPPDPKAVEFTEAKVAEFRALTEDGHGVWFGAFIEGEMRCGAGLFSEGRSLARYQSVETHPAFRRRGLASTLVARLGAWGLTELEASRLVMVADPDYHAIGMYRSLGFVDVEHQVGLQRPPAM